MKPLDCQKYQDLLDERWDGVTLSASDEASLQAHLDSCRACASFAQDMQELLGAARSLAEQRYERTLELCPMVLGARSPALGARLFAFGGAFAMAAAVILVVGLRATTPSPHEVVVRVAVPLAEAESVALLGDFTAWKDPIPLSRTSDGVWVGEVRVTAGRYRYVLVVDDGQVRTDPASSQIVDDGFGGKSSVLDVTHSL